MEEPYTEGLATRGGPESCVGVREGMGEALTGVRAGRDIEPRNIVWFLDAYAREQGVASRSAVIREAVRLLRASDLGSDYAQAWAEWASSDNSDEWESTVADGLPSSSRCVGGIRMIDLDPVRGSGADKRRPTVLVSNDGANTTATQLGRRCGDRRTRHVQHATRLPVPGSPASRGVWLEVGVEGTGRTSPGSSLRARRRTDRARPACAHGRTGRRAPPAPLALTPGVRLATVYEADRGQFPAGRTRSKEARVLSPPREEPLSTRPRAKRIQCHERSGSNRPALVAPALVRRSCACIAVRRLELAGQDFSLYADALPGYDLVGVGR